jgi:molybdopterin-guanine dinucleotide biosynthesis protein B
MKAVGIVGYKKSGKTSLLVKLARELTTRNYTVSSVKHVSEKLDLPDTDTYLHRQFTLQTAAIAPEESAIFFSESKRLNDILSYLDADFILIEGFKTEKSYPKIVCLREGDDLETVKSLIDGLEICIVGTSPNMSIDSEAPIFNGENDIDKIADLVQEKAFKLPNLDCKACGYNTCYEMAQRIVKGTKSVKDCHSLNADIRIEIDNNVIPLNPFVSTLIKNTITGMLSSLKDYRKGKIEINIK